MSNYWEVPAQDFIKEELTVYTKENNISKAQDVVNKLLELAPSAYEDEWKNYSSAAKAWMTLQMLKQSSLTYHTSKELGEFIYDTQMYEVRNISDHLVLQYIDKDGLDPILPAGLKSCREMFADWKLPQGFTFGDKFDTSKIIDMHCMFTECKFPEGFTLGDNFDTSNVRNMSYMFSCCEFPNGFSLGDKFDTGKVTDMHDMFAACFLHIGFTLSNKFDTSKVRNMSYMFYGCKLHEGFTLGAKFDTSNVVEMRGMFLDSKLNGDPISGTNDEILQMFGGKQS